MREAWSALVDVLEPLTEESRRRVQDFDCGDAQANSFIKEHAWQQQRNLLNRTYLVRHDPPDLCPGYIALGTAHIESQLTDVPLKKLVYADAPALLIGRMAVDRRFQRMGVGRDLIAATRLIASGLPVGCRFVVLHVDVTNTPARRLYESEGFRVPEDYEPDARGLLLMFYDLITRRPAGEAGRSLFAAF